MQSRMRCLRSGKDKGEIGCILGLEVRRNRRARMQVLQQRQTFPGPQCVSVARRNHSRESLERID